MSTKDDNTNNPQHDAKLPVTCRYGLAWIGECGKPCDESGFCEEHKGKKCLCGKQAEYECSACFQFVCGYPMCGEDCKHKHS